MDLRFQLPLADNQRFINERQICGFVANASLPNKKAK